MKIDWLAVLKHLIAGLVVALGSLSTLSSSHHLTLTDWLSVAVVFLTASGASATTSGGITVQANPGTSVLVPQAAFVGPDTAPVTPSPIVSEQGPESLTGPAGSTLIPTPPMPMPTIDNLAPAPVTPVGAPVPAPVVDPTAAAPVAAPVA